MAVLGQTMTPLWIATSGGNEGMVEVDCAVKMRGGIIWWVVTFIRSFAAASQSDHCRCAECWVYYAQPWKHSVLVTNVTPYLLAYERFDFRHSSNPVNQELWERKWFILQSSILRNIIPP